MKPAVPTILGSGPLADEMRRMVAADPDRYRPQSISSSPVGHCPCCDKDVFRVTGRVTGFEEGFATGIGDEAVRHPSFNPAGVPKGGDIIGCCCVAPNWGPKHQEDAAPSAPARKRRKKRGV